MNPFVLCVRWTNVVPNGHACLQVAVLHKEDPLATREGYWTRVVRGDDGIRQWTARLAVCGLGEALRHPVVPELQVAGTPGLEIPAGVPPELDLEQVVQQVSLLPLRELPTHTARSGSLAEFTAAVSAGLTRSTATAIDIGEVEIRYGAATGMTPVSVCRGPDGTGDPPCVGCELCGADLVLDVHVGPAGSFVFSSDVRDPAPHPRWAGFLAKSWFEAAVLRGLYKVARTGAAAGLLSVSVPPHPRHGLSLVALPPVTEPLPAPWVAVGDEASNPCHRGTYRWSVPLRAEVVVPAEVPASPRRGVSVWWAPVYTVGLEPEAAALSPDTAAAAVATAGLWTLDCEKQFDLVTEVDSGWDWRTGPRARARPLLTAGPEPGLRLGPGAVPACMCIPSPGPLQEALAGVGVRLCAGTTGCPPNHVAILFRSQSPDVSPAAAATATILFTIAQLAEFMRQLVKTGFISTPSCLPALEALAKLV